MELYDKQFGVWRSTRVYVHCWSCQDNFFFKKEQELTKNQNKKFNQICVITKIDWLITTLIV